MIEIDANVELTHVQPGDKIVRDGQRYNVIEPSQVSAQLLPSKAKAKTYLLKVACGCSTGKNGSSFRATASNLFERSFEGERLDLDDSPLKAGDTGLDCRICKQPVRLVESAEVAE